MKFRLENALGRLLVYMTAHPSEVRWSVIGSVSGGVAGLFVGSVAISVPVWAVLAVLGGLIGNRFGSQKDGRPV